MKYLKLYESMEDDILLNLKEMLLELEDIGFNVKVNKFDINERSWYNINIFYFRKYGFLTGDIKEYILRTIDYMSALNFSSDMTIDIKGSGGRKIGTKFLEAADNINILGFFINFEKIK